MPAKTLIIWAIVAIAMMVATVFGFIPFANGHDIHFSDVNDGVIVRMGRDAQRNPFYCYEDGNCWVIYKDGDLNHSGLHAVSAFNKLSVTGEEEDRIYDERRWD